MKLLQKIERTLPKSGEIAVFYLAQAGFLFKSHSGKIICADPYLSDCCERMFKFKRMIPAPLEMSEMRADIIVSTHSHADHLDPDLLERVKDDSSVKFVGSPDCLPVYKEAGISENRVTILAAGQSGTVDGAEFRAVYADHGELAPDAVGFLITIDGVTVYDCGDTSYCPEKIQKSLGNVNIDIMIAPINSAYGNLGHENACRLAELLKPRALIGSHFGMFIEHGGDPGAFLEFAKNKVSAFVMAPGERMIYSRQTGIVSMKTVASEDI